MHDWKPYSLALVPGILNVPVSQCCSRRTKELLVKPIDGASGIAQHAVDTGGELIVSFQFLCALTVFTLFRRRLFLPDYPRLDLHKLPHEVVHVDDEVFDNREVWQWFHSDRSAFEFVEKAGTGEFRDSVDVRSTASADSHSARPAIG